MKNFGYTVNIEKNQNFTVSHSDSDWRAMRKNSYIVFGEDNDFYKVLSTEPYFFVTEYEAINDKQVKTKNIGFDLIEGDNCLFSYKQFELGNVRVINGGRLYNVGDILIPDGGKIAPSFGVLADDRNYSVLKVLSVKSGGAIESLQILDLGKYIVAPETNCPLISQTGKGIGARISVNYNLSEYRPTIEKQINSIENRPGESIITLDYGLPKGVTKGKLSVHKWKAYLDRPYKGENQRNISYKILRDFTPHCHIPLIPDNNPLVIMKIFNQAMEIIDKKFKELDH